MQWLRWAAPVVAAAAVFLLPALQASAPFSPVQRWSVAELAGEIAQAATAGPGRQDQSSATNLRQLLRHARELQQWLPAESQQNRAALDRALLLALPIPFAVLLAGIAALLSVAATALERRWPLRACAAAGLAASLYAMAASWWMTRTARRAVGQALAQAQHSFGGLPLGLDWNRLQAGLTRPLGLVPQAGLLVLALAFLAMLAAPAPARPR